MRAFKQQEKPRTNGESEELTRKERGKIGAGEGI
jgi:hypothetical protein